MYSMSLNKPCSQAVCFPTPTQPGNVAKHEPEQADNQCARDESIPKNVLSIVGVSGIRAQMKCNYKRVA